MLFPVFVGIAALTVVRLWETGTRAALYSTEGQAVEIVSDPTQPGFEAFVDPTPTLLIAHTDNGELIGVTVIARTSLEGGGSIVLIGPDLFVRPDPAVGDEGRFLTEAFASEGVEGVTRQMEIVFGFGFLDAVELSSTELAAAMGLAAPIAVELADDLLQGSEGGDAGVWLQHGSHQLDGPTAAAVYSSVNPGEVEVNRQNRQKVLWQSWLAGIGSAEDPAAVAGVGDPVLASYLLPLASGELRVEVLPTRLVAFDASEPFYVMENEDLAWLARTSDAMVPVPLPASGESWPRIRLLDGSGDQATLNGALATLFDLRMQVSIVGNASEFGVERSGVAYHDAEEEAAAAAVAATLGIGLEFSDEPGLAEVFTVLIGEDWPLS